MFSDIDMEALEELEENLKQKEANKTQPERLRELQQLYSTFVYAAERRPHDRREFEEWLGLELENWGVFAEWLIYAR